MTRRRTRLRFRPIISILFTLAILVLAGARAQSTVEHSSTSQQSADAASVPPIPGVVDATDHGAFMHHMHGEKPAPATASTAAMSEHVDEHGASMHSGDGHAMYFTWRTTGPILFYSLDVTSTQMYLAFCIALACACFLREYLATYRLELERANTEWRMLQAAAAATSSATSASGVRLETHRRCCGLISTTVLSSLLYVASMALAYAIMLVVMTFDGILCLIILAASGVAHYWYQHTPNTQSAASLLSPPASIGGLGGGGGKHAAAGDMRFRRGGSNGGGHAADDEEREALTPSLGRYDEEDAVSHQQRRSPAATSSSHHAAIALAIAKDCCDS